MTASASSNDVNSLVIESIKTVLPSGGLALPRAGCLGRYPKPRGIDHSHHHADTLAMRVDAWRAQWVTQRREVRPARAITPG